MIRVVIGLGTNLGDRRAHLEHGVRELFLLAAPGSFRLASLYETPPLGPPQPDYLNSAVSFESPLEPEALLDEALRIEAEAGRVRNERWGPRTLDLDLLCAIDDRGSEVSVDSARLTLPHPELTRRTFALAPLLEVLPELEGRYGSSLAALGGPPRVVGRREMRRKGWTASVSRK
jgi:2-amino-4-hydroxy-6-hydroxymethyldihydropteridine diphosphokinase